MSEMTELEVLRATRARLLGDAEWAFGDWSMCTCGHIYAAADCTFVEEPNIAHPRDGSLYDRTLKVIRRANPDWVDDDGRNYSVAAEISDATIAVGDSLGLNHVWGSGDDPETSPSAGAALVLVDAAIHMLEDEYEQARKKVAKRAQQRKGPKVAEKAKVTV
jgi:hypothetical protein